MKNLIILIAIVFIAVITASYFYFSNLGHNEQSRQAAGENAEANAAAGEEVPAYAEPLWTVDLNAELVIEPTVCFYDDTSRFILVQDAYHILYAISTNGEELWNAQLPGTILDSIQQLSDRSLVFTTTERLYRIDTEGDPLPGFSLQLPQKATRGAQVSHESGKDIRIDVRAGNRILSYDGRGRYLQSRPGRSATAGERPEQGEESTKPDTSVTGFPTDCGPLFYYGPLDDSDRNYLLCGNDDRKLRCYSY